MGFTNKFITGGAILNISLQEIEGNGEVIFLNMDAMISIMVTNNFLSPMMSFPVEENVLKPETPVSSTCSLKSIHCTRVLLNVLISTFVCLAPHAVVAFNNLNRA